MRKYSSSIPRTKTVENENSTWIRGLNTNVSNTQIRKDEMSLATDIQIIEDGKIQCPRDGQAYYGSTSGSRVTGLHSFYKSDGTKKLIRTSATKLQEYNGSGWDDVSGYTYTTTLDTNFVTAYDRAYIVNGTDPLTYYDGSTITSFSSISAPSAPTVTRTGSAGTYTFSYKITAISATGETEASTAGTTTLNQATLDDTSYMNLSWSAVTNAIGYSIYGRKDGQWSFIAYNEGNGSVTYVDKGVITPSEYFPAPEANSTDGPTGKYITVYKDSLFIAGDPTAPSRLYYSAGGAQINDFTIANGGGFIDISRNDGQSITGLVVYRNSLIVFKDRSIYQFQFTTEGLPSLVQINPRIGCVSSRSIVAVENDVLFLSHIGIYALGNEAGFAFDVLRTNELSSRIRTIIKAIEPTKLSRVSALYVNDSSKKLVIFSYTPSGMTTNSEAVVWDRERLGWYKWTNINANSWTEWVDSSDDTHFLYGDDSSGYVKEILSGTSDFGSAISGIFRLRAEDFGKAYGYKRLMDVDLIFREPQGSITFNIIKEGVTTEQTVNISTVTPSVNFGHYIFSEFTFADSTGSGVSAQDESILRSIRTLNLEGRSFLYEFANVGSGSFVLIEVHDTARFRPSGRRDAEEIVTV